MTELEKEIGENFRAFSQSYKKSLEATTKTLKSHRAKFLDSYARLVSLNAWQAELLSSKIKDDSLAFFVEARNDALTSHVLAGFGSWRSSLKALRSCIENVLYSLFYKDHPVELLLWHAGNHKLMFSELMAYFRAHPALKEIPENMSGLDLLAEQYSVLSRAVHGSAQDFRMSANGATIRLWSSDIARLGKWSKNERDVLVGLNRLLLALFKDDLQQMRLPNLRQVVGLVIRPDHHVAIKAHFGVSLSS